VERPRVPAREPVVNRREVTMRTILSLLLLAAAPGFAAAQATKEDLKKLSKAGVSDDVILAYIKANGLATKPSSDDLVELKAAGLSDKLLAGILTPAEAPKPQAAEREAPAPTPAPAPATVYVEQPTVYATGYWSVGRTYSYPSSYCAPVYRPYYSGSICRPYYSSYYRPYCGSYYRSSYCGPRFSLSYSSGRCRSGFGVRVRW